MVGSSSFFDLRDFSWREFASNFIPLIGNWLIATGKEVPTLLLETNFCLEELHEICNHMSEDIQTLLGSARFGDLDEIVKYLMNNDYFYPDINCICERLKKNSFNYQKKIREFQKNLLKIKKKFPQGQKNFLDLDKKYKFFCPLAP